ncbi:hypothetical protein JD844_021202 [Phrynosoma platyrhinos]|uniref:Uncharacterized protein n=1 Tax=Phrynosoma platyrhinos TaxID=52577 RepID=A0ABQ7STD0_PHRPL|nr:hypothetical protein JD844_021202 [Phrynosoma platyrhinos]
MLLLILKIILHWKYYALSVYNWVELKKFAQQLSRKLHPKVLPRRSLKTG